MSYWKRHFLFFSNCWGKKYKQIDTQISLITTRISLKFELGSINIIVELGRQSLVKYINIIWTSALKLVKY